MSVRFDASASQSIANDAAPLQSGGYPLIVGLWVRPFTSGSSQRYWAAVNPNTLTDIFFLGQTSGSAFAMGVTDSGGTTQRNLGAITYGAWSFLLGRFLSSTLRWFDLIQADGTIVAQAMSPTSRTPSTVTRMALGGLLGGGATSYCDAEVAEFWFSASGTVPPVLAADASLPEPQLRQLAYGGPFSMPAIAAQVSEYHSYRAGPIAGGYRDHYAGAGAAWPTWTRANGPTVGSHPPVPQWLANQGQRRLLPF